MTCAYTAWDNDTSCQNILESGYYANFLGFMVNDLTSGHESCISNNKNWIVNLYLNLLSSLSSFFQPFTGRNTAKNPHQAHNIPAENTTVSILLLQTPRKHSSSPLSITNLISLLTPPLHSAPVLSSPTSSSKPYPSTLSPLTPYSSKPPIPSRQ